MTITAKFASQCPKCRTHIEIGEKVEWVKGSKATHKVCPLVRNAGDCQHPAFHKFDCKCAVSFDEDNSTAAQRFAREQDEYLSEQEMDRDDASYMAWLASSRPITIAPVQSTDNDDASYEAWQTFQTQIAQCGVYVLPDDTIVRIKMNLEKTGSYTKRWVHISGFRLTESVDPETLKNNRSHGDYEYAPELKAQALSVGRKMTRDEALKFSTIYGICAWCGRTLVAAKSVERGIGPVCIKRFAEGTTAVDLMVAA